MVDFSRISLFLFSGAGYAAALIAFSLGIFIIFKNPHSEINRAAFVLTFTTSIWSLGLATEVISPTRETGLFWSRFLHAGVIVIPVAYFHFISALIGILKKRKTWIILGYSVVFILSVLNIKGAVVSDVSPKDFFNFYTDPGPAYPFLLITFFIFTSNAFYSLLKKFREYTGLQKMQLKYMVLASVIGFVAGSLTFLPVFNISNPFVLLGQILVIFYPIFVGYGILKYRLMDIRVAVTRAGLFTVVYSVVLGSPFYIGYITKSWLIVAVSMFLFATAGPVIYTYLRKRAEDLLLAQRKKYQKALLAISEGMTLIKELDRLIPLITRIMQRYIGVAHAEVYLQDPSVNGYRCQKRIKPKSQASKSVDELILARDSKLIEHLKSSRDILLYDELHISNNSKELIKDMDLIKANIAIPCFIQDELVGFLSMSRKKSGDMYTQDDLKTFWTLSNQAAIAIENATYFAESKKTLVDQFHEHRLRSLGQMGSHMGHQVGNRFNAISAKADELKMVTLEALKNSTLTDEQKQHIKYLKETIQTMQDDALLGGDIAKSLKEFSAKDMNIKPVDLEDTMRTVLRLLQCKFDTSELNLSVDIQKTDLEIKADQALLQDILFNLLDNAHDAQNIKKQHTQDYTPKTSIKAYIKDDNWTIEVSDNGIGMTPEQLERLFVPFFTAKASSEKKNIGIGMIVIKKMLTALKGQISVESEHKKGTTFYLTLSTIRPDL